MKIPPVLHWDGNKSFGNLIAAAFLTPCFHLLQAFSAIWCG